MNKCKRNVLYIFGYILIVALLFVPYEKQSYLIEGKYKLISKPLNKSGFKFLPLYIADVINHKRFKEWKKRSIEDGNKIRENKKVITTEELFYLETEFIKKYGGKFRYDKLKLDFLITELAIILLIGVFVYILNCIIFGKQKIKIPKIFIIALIVLALSIFILSKFSKREDLANNIIQGTAILALVFVTFFYAIQTQKLVKQEKISLEEEKKKRYAEFGEKRIKEFLIMSREKLLSFELMLSISSEKKNLVGQNITNLRIFHYQNKFLATDKTNELILKFIEDTEKFLNARPEESKENLKKEISVSHFNAIEQIDKEIKSIEDNIKETYGYFKEKREAKK